MKEQAIAFDFDGALVSSGFDKAMHINYSAFAACWQTGYRCFLHPDDLNRDISAMFRAFRRYPGAPRFEQLSAITNSIITGRPEAVTNPAEFGVSEQLQQEYSKVRETYDRIYSSLNSVAADKYWKPFPSAKKTIAHLAQKYDLYIASGVVQDILEKDFDHHGFDRSLFCGIKGSNPAGGSDKADILKWIKSRGYKEILFAADSSRDLEYARKAGVKFFRIIRDADFPRLLHALENGMPDENQPWDYTQEEMDYIRRKILYPMQQLVQGKPLTAVEITDWFNSEPLPDSVA